MEKDPEPRRRTQLRGRLYARIQALKELAGAGLISREILETYPLSPIYRRTPKGKSLAKSGTTRAHPTLPCREADGERRRAGNRLPSATTET